MGHSQASKAQTHQRVVKAAAARFREQGLDGVSLSELMQALGLTHGGFYKHFASRDALVAEAVDDALADGEQQMRGELFKDGKPTLPRLIKTYLSEAHRDSRATGCPLAALFGDVARKGDELQAALGEQIERNLTLFGEALVEVPTGRRREEALFVLSALYGALTMARGVGDSALSREILRSVRERLLAQTSAPPARRRRSAKRLAGGAA